tara:strand:- start:111 stop:455 length:345 start_codon:yes stop_codon:yes gene_type:complete
MSTKRSKLALTPGEVMDITSKGFFIDANGNVFMQTNGEFYEAGGYDPRDHGEIIPKGLVKKRDSLKVAQFPRISDGSKMTNVEQKQGLEVLKNLKGPQKRKQLKIFMDQYMKGV